MDYESLQTARVVLVWCFLGAIGIMCALYLAGVCIELVRWWRK